MSAGDRDAHRLLTSAGAPAIKVDPNGEFEVEQMYVQCVKFAQPRARVATAAVGTAEASGA